MATDTLASSPDAPGTPKSWLWAGRAMTALFVLFMVFDTAIKLLRLPIVDDTLIALGYPTGIGLAIGVLEAILLALYLIPRTSLLGAVLFTGLFGGAIATMCGPARRCSATCSSASISASSLGLGCGCAMQSCAPCFPFSVE